MKNYEIIMHFYNDTETHFYLEFDLFEETVAPDHTGSVFMVTDEGEIIELTQVKYIEVVNLRTNEVKEMNEYQVKEWMDKIKGSFLIQ